MDLGPKGEFVICSNLIAAAAKLKMASEGKPMTDQRDRRSNWGPGGKLVADGLMEGYDKATEVVDRVMAKTVARPARIVIKELPRMLRGRPLGAVPALLRQGLRAAGLPAGRIDHEDDEEAAALALLAWAQPGDVVVLPVHTTAVREALTVVLAASGAGPQNARP